MKLLLPLLFAASALALGPAARADERFIVSPARAELSAQRPVVTVQIVNTGVEPLAVQAKALRWPALPNAIAPDAVPLSVSPALASIAPGRRHTMRVALLDRAPAQGSYRIVFTALPTARDLGDIGAPTPRHASVGLPLVVVPAAAVRPVQWQVASETRAAKGAKPAPSRATAAKPQRRVAKAVTRAERRAAAQREAAHSNDS